MNRVKFGKIVKSLRAEHIDHISGGSWTQKQLAKETGLTEIIIGNIERGKKTKLESDEIAILADALRLSTMERQEFFTAATEVEENSVTAELLEKDMAFEHVWSILAETKLPAFLIDPLFNLVGINRIMMSLHGVTNPMLDTIAQTELGVNVLSLMFREKAIMRKSMGKEWDDIARATLHQYRYTALRYRSTVQFETILAHMHTQPDFSRLWIETRATPDKDFFSQLRHYNYPHTIHGHLCYAATLSMVVTNYGNLYLTTHIPCDSETLAKFTEIGQENQGARKVMSWPLLTNNQ